MRKKNAQNRYKALVDNIFGEDLVAGFDCDTFILDENITTPSPKCLIAAGWKLSLTNNNLPHCPGVYIIHCGDRECRSLYLYVGQGLDLVNRLQSHPQWLKATREYATPIIFFWDFKEIEKRQLLRFEAYVIGLTNPKWNFGSIAGMHKGITIDTFNNFWDD